MAFIGRAGALVGHIDKPVVTTHGAKDISRAIKTRAQLGVSLEVIQLLLERRMGEILLAGKGVVLAGVTDPFQLHTQGIGELKQGGDATEQGGGATGLEHDLVRPDEEAGLGQEVSILVVVGDHVEDGAAGLLAELIKLLAGKSTTAQGVLPYTRLEAHFQSLLWTLKLSRNVWASLIGLITR